MREEWRPVVGWEGIYVVSSEGRMRSRRGLLTTKRRSNGYLYIDLCRHGRKKRTAIHRLVAEAFIGPPPSEAHIPNHKNGVKDDNRPENLGWTTQSENNVHALRTGLRSVTPLPGERNGRARLTRTQVLAIRLRAQAGEAQRALAREFGVSKSQIGNIVRGEQWR